MARRIIYNDDGDGAARARQGHVQEDIEAWIDKPLGKIPIDTYAWCIAYPDMVQYDSKVAEVYGQRFDKPHDRIGAAIAELIERGTDVLEVVANHVHRRGLEFMASIRMDDTHSFHPFPDGAYPVSQFLLDHPEYAITRCDGFPETALDYSYRPVREHRLAILREIAEDYEVEGLELDFQRTGKFFARQEAPFKVDVMSDYVDQVRQILNEAAAKRGCDRLVLGVQVMGSLYLNHLAGLDPKAWVANDWLDYIIQCDFNCTDPQIPVAEFADFCRGSRCTHHVRMGNMMGGRWDRKPYITGRKTAFKGCPGYCGMVLTPEEARGAAANAYGFGADGIGLWNLCCNMGGEDFLNVTPFQQDIFDWANEVADPSNVWSRRRVYHFVPLYKSAHRMMRNYAVNECRQSPDGQPGQIIVFWPLNEGYRVPFRFWMADGKHGQSLEGTLRFRILQSTVEDKFAFDINGQPIDTADIRLEAVNDNELPYVWYEIDLARCPPFAGHNELGMTLLKLTSKRDDLGDTAMIYEIYPYMEQLIITVEP